MSSRSLRSQPGPPQTSAIISGRPPETTAFRNYLYSQELMQVFGQRSTLGPLRLGRIGRSPRHAFGDKSPPGARIERCRSRPPSGSAVGIPQRRPVLPVSRSPMCMGRWRHPAPGGGRQVERRVQRYCSGWVRISDCNRLVVCWEISAAVGSRRPARRKVKSKRSLLRKQPKTMTGA